VRKWLALGLAVLTAAVVPVRVCAEGAGDWLDGDAETQRAFERGVWALVTRPLSRADFPTGSRVIDGEWLFATYMMAGMGFAQIALEHPERAVYERHQIEYCVDWLIAPATRAFDAEAWGGHDPIDDLLGTRAHVSFLGYLNLLLGLERQVSDKHADLHERVTEALVRRFERADGGLLESYPHAVFPVDNAAAIASIALYDRVRGRDHHALVVRFVDGVRKKWRDPKTGLLLQTWPGRPRGSGTALAAYFLGFADEPLSRELWEAAARALYDTRLGFGALREYPRGIAGRSDADSGPQIAGFGVSATGFALGAARMHGDAERFAHLYATVELFGGPVTDRDGRHYAAGGSVGNAILFAMLTAPRLHR
jgi:hypothetical protein